MRQNHQAQLHNRLDMAYNTNPNHDENLNSEELSAYTLNTNSNNGMYESQIVLCDKSVSQKWIMLVHCHYLIELIPLGPIISRSSNWERLKQISDRPSIHPTTNALYNGKG